VLQTTAGKMIFGKFDERGMSSPRPEVRTEPRPMDPRPDMPRPDVRKSGPTPAAVSEGIKPE
jgi:hypothetical protein